MERNEINNSGKDNQENELNIGRFGHTTTLINSNQVVLYGGAKSVTELYNDAFLYNIKEKSWVKLNPSGDIPSARAAHAACCKDKDNVLIFGGANKSGGFASSELYMLQIFQDKSKSKWSIINCKELKPQKRYGHTMIYSKPNLILFGGVLKDKNKLSNDLWILNLEKLFNEEDIVLEWKQIEYKENAIRPPPRMYHSTGICKSGRAKGMILLFGGRGEKSIPLNDAWGLRKHRDGTWEWIKAPKANSVTPIKRYQHSCLFYANNMIILGGLGELDDVNNSEGIAVEIYNCDTLEWSSHFSFNKFRHSSVLLEKYAFTFGGCDYLNPLEPTDKIVMFDVQELCTNLRKKSKASYRPQINNNNINLESDIHTNLNNISLNKHSKITDENIKPVIVNKVEISFINNSAIEEKEKSMSSNSVDLNISNNGNLSGSNNNSNITSFSHTKNINIPSNYSVKKISLKDSSKFITINDDEDFSELYENFINTLLKPTEWKNTRKSEDNCGFSKFRFRREHIIALTKACQELIASQPMVLRINAPVKIFGDIHGQYEDLMRFFELWGEPSENPGVGDIQSIDYLFLGDYVDRGINSLETICLLMALKIKYPDRVHLLRGNHEDMMINLNFGFREECDIRLFEDTEDEDLNVYRIINEFFEYLPLAAIIEDQILCLHGGIGGCLQRISDIEEIDRPLTIIHEATNKTEQIVMDILWSDPTDNDEELGIQSNPLRDTKAYGNIVKYGPDVVERFLKQNDLSMIVRAHECVPDGFERFDGGNLITLFSATDYCRRHKNAGAMLLIKNNFEIIPHLIYPISSGHVKWIDNEEGLKKRPPTPLRRNKRKNDNK